MEIALYHPQYGYYRTSRDPFGKHGDFYTAAQLQPAFGRLIRTILEKLPVEHTLIDIGAGRSEMQEEFSNWNYYSVDVCSAHPQPVQGVIFANELFDALPCRVYDAHGHEVLVNIQNDRFTWTGIPSYERCLRISSMMQSMRSILDEGYLLIIDYGYEEREQQLRFPQGSLMSYHRHVASEDVLADPGLRDITAHVNFTEVTHHAVQAGFELIKKYKLSSFLLEAGEEEIGKLTKEHSQQLRSLLFGMGELFDVLLFRTR